jgi:Flp pilus assembly protein TadG
MSVWKRLRSRNHDDGVVTVILAAGVLFVLLGFGAFAVDVSQAYTVRRQLSSAADSASLAAAWGVAAQDGVVGGIPQTCTQMQALGGSLAQSTAAKYTSLNTPIDSMQPANVTATVSCPPGDYAMDVTAVNNASVPSVFGGVLGVKSLKPTQSAIAQVSVINTVTGLRPYAICAGDPAFTEITTETTTWHVVQYAFPGSKSACAPSTGDWFILTCPPKESPGTTLAGDTQNGCQNPVTALDSADPVTLYNDCNVASPAPASCLNANTGANLTDSQVLAAWDTLLGKTILIPVIYPATVSCPPHSIGDTYFTQNCGGGGGSGFVATYPVSSFLPVEVCGYHWDHKNSGVYSASSSTSPDPCRNLGQRADGLPSTPADATPDLTGVSPASADNYLLLAYASPVIVSGTVGPAQPGPCALGSPCDHGDYAVSLIK